MEEGDIINLRLRQVPAGESVEYLEDIPSLRPIIDRFRPLIGEHPMFFGVPFFRDPWAAGVPTGSTLKSASQYTIAARLSRVENTISGSLTCPCGSCSRLREEISKRLQVAEPVDDLC